MYANFWVTLIVETEHNGTSTTRRQAMAAIKAGRSFSQFVCLACRQRALPPMRRAFTTTTPRRAEEDEQNRGQPPSPMTSTTHSSSTPADAPSTSAAPSTSSFVPSASPSPSSSSPSSSRPNRPFSLFSSPASGPEDVDRVLADVGSRNLDFSGESEEGPHRLHVFSTKHNTHLTLVQPPRPASEMTGSRAMSNARNVAQSKKIVDMVMTYTTGNIGFKKAGRGSYDAAYQLAAFFLKQMAERGIIREIRRLEIVLNGWGAGREAVTKALLGTEGRHVRHRISAVMDATKLKQGGPRSKRPRRLG